MPRDAYVIPYYFNVLWKSPG